MRVLISGPNGLIGRALRRALEPQHSIAVLSRSPSPGNNPEALFWDPVTGVADARRLEGFDAVVHLAGEPIAGRWSASKKRAIRDSRVLGTQTLCRQLAQLDAPPKNYIGASAVGYYGDAGDAWVDEGSRKGQGFLADVCEAWESAADSLQVAGTRVVHARFGMVLGPGGGALGRLLPLFRLGLGGRVGSGSQYWSWIALADAAAALAWLLEQPAIAGAVNVVSPEPVTNKVFTDCLAAAVKRPAFFPLPAWAAKLLLGEMAEALLLCSARVRPQVLSDAGFVFQTPGLKAALNAIRDEAQ